MTLLEKIHGDMMTITGKWSDGEIGVIRFAVGFYSRFLLGFALSCTFRQRAGIIEPSLKQQLAVETKR